MKKEKNNKHVFWQALVFTIIVFILGFILGFFLEVSRNNEVMFNVLESEANLLDEQLRGKVITDFNISCDVAVKNSFVFADRVYLESLEIENFQGAAKFTDDLKSIHKRYDLLRTILWTESVKLREKCKEDFHTVVYLFNYNEEDIETKAKQLFFSRLLEDLKNKHSEEVLLIPIAVNLGLDSVELAISKYQINNLPAVIIDEEKVVDEVISFEEFERRVMGIRT